MRGIPKAKLQCYEGLAGIRDVCPICQKSTGWSCLLRKRATSFTQFGNLIEFLSVYTRAGACLIERALH